MSHLAHLSDLHLDGSKKSEENVRRALSLAWDARPDHLVITGDLTESGRDEELSQLAGCLLPWPAYAVTVVPGNHDQDAGSWTEAMSRTGLDRFARSSAPGAVRDLGDCVIVAVDSRCDKRAPIFRALGHVSDEQVCRAREVIAQNQDRPVVIAMHHGPQWHPLHPWDGLTNCGEVKDLLEKGPNAQVLCGHDHRSLDLMGGQVHCAPSVRDCAQPLRLYEVVGRRLVPTVRGDRGSYLMGLG